MKFNINGYKTYGLAVLAVVYAVSGYFTAHLGGKEALDIIWAALSVAAIRHGIANQ